MRTKKMEKLEPCPFCGENGEGSVMTIMENTNEIENVEWQYSEFLNVYYYFCGKCGSEILEGTDICPFCKCKENWSKVPKRF